jgi:DNA-directed RNA polymerase specialized sigma subunit
MTTPQKKINKPIPELRQELLADNDTQRIAKALKMPIEEYVELVLDYVQNPEKDPEVYVPSEDQLREMGVEPVSMEYVEEGLTKILDEVTADFKRNADVADLSGSDKGAQAKKLSGEPAHSEPVKSRGDIFGGGA